MKTAFCTITTNISRTVELGFFVTSPFLFDQLQKVLESFRRVTVSRCAECTEDTEIIVVEIRYNIDGSEGVKQCVFMSFTPLTIYDRSVSLAILHQMQRELLDQGYTLVGRNEISQNF